MGFEGYLALEELLTLKRLFCLEHFFKDLIVFPNGPEKLDGIWLVQFFDLKGPELWLFDNVLLVIGDDNDLDVRGACREFLELFVEVLTILVDELHAVIEYNDHPIQPDHIYQIL